MSNMSYCRFQNTLLDLQDCDQELGDMGDHLDGHNEYDEPLSEEELFAAKRLLKLCKKLAERYDDEELT